MAAPIFIQLTPDEDAQLQQRLNNPNTHPKVRRRALAVRLSAQHWSAPRIAQCLGCHHTTVLNDLKRWQQHRYDGLADGKARRVPMPQHGMLPNCPQAQQPRPRLENACRSQRAGCGAALYLVNSLTIAAPLLQVSRGWVFCRRACLQSCRAGHLCHHASETLALPAHATLGTRASRPQSRPREKKTYPSKLLQVPPPRRGNRTLARFPSRSGGNLRRGAVVNSGGAVGIRACGYTHL